MDWDGLLALSALCTTAGTTITVHSTGDVLESREHTTKQSTKRVDSDKHCPRFYLDDTDPFLNQGLTDRRKDISTTEISFE